jgi:predicted GTPase
MNVETSHEQRFIAEVDAFEFIAHDVNGMLHDLESWLARLADSMRAHRLASPGLKDHGTLAKCAEAVNITLQDILAASAQKWTELEPAHALAESFDDKALLLVFGKFNAGKSSFCNFLAERFARHGKTVQYFHVEAGRVVETDERFKEGVTETTARLQGVCLAGKLVLVDTPGLHSVTPENAALTQRFTDSADGVLWLTSSTSPGQVQELDELGRELHRNKPLLPVVTRSDVYEEDEIDGEIRKILRGKSEQNRAEQEADVKARAKEKLLTMEVAAELLKAPVSISCYLARELDRSPAAMIAAGFERLYAALFAIAEPALIYKRRKFAEMFLHHLEENVVSAWHRTLLPLLAALNASAEHALQEIEPQTERIANAVWRSVIRSLPQLLETHSATRDVAAVRGRVLQALSASFAVETDRQWNDYGIDHEACFTQIEMKDDANFEEIVVELSQAGNDSNKVVGVDYGRLHAALRQATQEHALRMSRIAAQQCRASVKQLMQCTARLQYVLNEHEEELRRLKQQLRSEYR